MLSKDLVAASSRPLVLSILAGGESYGYEILQQVRTLSAGEVKWKDGMLYPVLHKLQQEGLVEAEWRTAANGRRRKYYRLQEKGSEALNKEKAQWAVVQSMLHKLWGAPCLT